ncbi:MAG: hypothetical protein R3185_04695 [Candidatus Thermoplasmatota archaeon]|nr:hypothetical protein [Candidatus Thermoplasmatota archaeon]
MRGTLLVGLALLVAGLTGCIGEAPEASSPVAGDRGTPEPAGPTLVYEDCVEYLITFYIDLEQAVDLLPEGLEPRTYESTLEGTPVASEPAAQIRVPMGSCEVLVDGKPVGQVREMYVYVMIEPPEGFARAGADGHSYILTLFTDHPEVLAVHQAGGNRAATLGQVNVGSGTPDPADTGPVTITATANRASATFEGTLVGQENPANTEFAGSWRFVLADQQQGITGAADLDWDGQAAYHAAGRGSFTYEQGNVTVTTDEGELLQAGGDWTWEMVYTPLEDAEGGGR